MGIISKFIGRKETTKPSTDNEKTIEILKEKIFKDIDFESKLQEEEKERRKFRDTLVKKIMNELPQLHERQIRLFLFVLEKNSVQMKAIKGRFRAVTPRTLRRDLNMLANIGLIEEVGDKRTRLYKEPQEEI